MAAEDPCQYSEPEYALCEVHRVALFDQPDEGHNEIVLAGIDVVVPVELDADGDPLHDDTVSLQSLDGFSEQVLAVGHPDVRVDLDKRLVFYRFRQVLRGMYRIAVRIRNDWAQLGGCLIVAAEMTSWNGQKLDGASPPKGAAEAEGLIGHDWMNELHPDDEPETFCGGRPPEED